MAKKERGFEPRGLTIGYKELGTISIDELLHAIAADVHALKDIYGVKYVKAPRLKLFITNEYGEPVKVQRPTGGQIFYMHTHHYRPACLDYEL